MSSRIHGLAESSQHKDMAQKQISVQESLNFAQENAYLEGLLAGVSLMVEHAKQRLVQKIMDAPGAPKHVEEK